MDRQKKVCIIKKKHGSSKWIVWKIANQKLCFLLLLLLLLLPPLGEPAEAYDEPDEDVLLDLPLDSDQGERYSC